MPAQETTPKRPSIARSQHSSQSTTSQSPAEGHPAPPQRNHSFHKTARHVVGHTRMGPRNPSYGRNLGKLTKLTAANGREEDVASSPRSQGHGHGHGHARSHSGEKAPLPSPRHGHSMKRNQTSLALPRTASHTALKKNHSSGQLTRLGSTKNVAKQSRPDVRRAMSHAPEKAKRKSSPPPMQDDSKHATVHFDVGQDDEDEGNMEGVDDGWTEESASQSPNTTRDNTRSNTRQNSVILDPEKNPFKRPEEKPPDDGQHQAQPHVAHDDEDNAQPEELSPKESPPPKVDEKDFATDAPANDTVDIQPSSYHATPQARPPDADAIAKRLLQRGKHGNPPPQLSDVSALAMAEDKDARSVADTEDGTLAGTTVGTTPIISRFIGEHSTPASKDNTPQDQSAYLSQRQRQHSRTGSQQPQWQGQDHSDIVKRNRSTPNFVTPQSPNPSEGGSGTVTPGGPMHPSRTQQKLWLQRGLSNIEANSQQHLPSLLPSGRVQRSGAVPRQTELVEKEWVVVRRFRNPIMESVQRLKKLHGKNSKGSDEGSGNASPQKKSRIQAGQRTPVAESVRPTEGAVGAHRPLVSFALSAPDDDEDQREDWHNMSLMELEDATLEIRRQMWELQAVAEADD